MDTSYCQVHNEPVIFLETNASNSPQKGLCRVSEQTIKFLKQLIDYLYDYQQFIYEQFDAILISIEEEIKITQEQNNQLNQNLNVYDCSQKLNDRNQKFFDSINLQLQNLEKEIKFESFFTSIEKIIFKHRQRQCLSIQPYQLSKGI